MLINISIMSLSKETTSSKNVKSSLNESVCYHARVKWFNNRAGYGFATISNQDRKGEDVFVHHSGILVKNEQYRYLVEGEYIEFYLRKSRNSKHPYQASEIQGIDGGVLMCETHADVRNRRGDRGDGDGEKSDVGDRGNKKQDGQWRMVTKTSTD